MHNITDELEIYNERAKEDYKVIFDDFGDLKLIKVK